VGASGTAAKTVDNLAHVGDVIQARVGQGLVREQHHRLAQAETKQVNTGGTGERW